MGPWARGALTASFFRGSSRRLVPLCLTLAPRAIRCSTTATEGRDRGSQEQKQGFDWEQSASSPTWLTPEPKGMEEEVHSNRIEAEDSPVRKLRTPDTVSIYPRYPHEHVLSIQEVVDYVFAKGLKDIEVYNASYGAKYWIICSAPSSRAAYTHGHRLSKIGKKGRARSGVYMEGSRRDDWFVVDLQFCWVHIFVNDTKEQHWPYISHHCTVDNRIPLAEDGTLMGFSPGGDTENSN